MFPSAPPRATYTKNPGLDTQLTVRGKHASSYEYNFAAALDSFGMGYLFQVDYMGGRKLLGGLVLDFLVFTRPLPTPVWINGEYWHQGGRTNVDFLQQTALLQLFGGRIAPAKIYWGKDVGTYDDARRTVRRDIL